MSEERTKPTTSDEVRRVIDQIFLRFGVSGLEERRADQAWVKVDRDEAAALITHLKEIGGYGHLAFLTAVDRIEEGNFRLIYMLHNHALKHDLGVMVDIGRESPEMDSVHRLWPTAETYQRELREMYGVRFPGSPRLDADFALEGWDGPPPMRRDFDTREYSEKTYYARPGRTTNDPREYMKKNLYPSEAETW